MRVDSGLAKAPKDHTATLTSPNFVVRYKEGQATTQEAQIVSDKAEGFYKKLAAYLGREVEKKIV